MIINLILLVVGMVLLVKGADFFVEGSGQIAKAIKIPSIIVGLTIVSMGTSAPELSISITSSIKGLNDISFGNIIGSNLFNTLVVIGSSALILPVCVTKDVKKLDIPILIGIYLILAFFGFVFSPLILTQVEAAILFMLFIAYTVFLIYRGKKANVEETPETLRKWYINVIYIAIGLAAIIFGGNFVVDSASYVAKALGMSDILVGLTIVAIGTSLPELVTSMVAAAKGEQDIALGNAIGSSLFNVVLILGASGMISPIPLAESYVFDVLYMLVSAVIVFFMSLDSSEKIGRLSGIVLILAYALYTAYIIMRNLGMM